MRVLKWLGVLVLVAAGGGWFAAKLGIEAAVSGWLASQADAGRVASAAEVSVGGFPAALDLSVTDLQLADPAAGSGLRLPALSVRAASWAPWRLTATLPPAFAVTLPDQGIALQSLDLQAILAAKPEVDLPLDVVSVQAASLQMQSDLGWTLALSDAFVTLAEDATRPAGAYRLTLDLAPMTPDPAFHAALQAVALPDLPAPDFPDRIEMARAEIGLRLTAPLDRHLGDSRPQLMAVEIASADFGWGALALHAEGLIEADAEGFAAGSVELQLTNWDRLPALLVATGQLKPEIAPTVGGLLKALAAESPDPTVLTLALDMAGGRMSLGPFPLGPAPRLHPPAS